MGWVEERTVIVGWGFGIRGTGMNVYGFVRLLVFHVEHEIGVEWGNLFDEA
jgi:hypothetical protein